MNRFLVVLALLVLVAACSSQVPTQSAPQQAQPSAQAAPVAQQSPAPTVAPVQPQAQPPTPAPSPASTETSITIKGFAFLPATVTVKAGTKVTWTNQDGAAHTVETADGYLRSDDLAQGQSYSKVMDKPGTYAYFCGIHKSMRGTITVE